MLPMSDQRVEDARRRGHKGDRITEYFVGAPVSPVSAVRFAGLDALVGSRVVAAIEPPAS